MARANPDANQGGATMADNDQKPSARSAADALKALLESSLKTSQLQSEYQATYRSLPGLLEVAGAIRKKQQESEQAFDKGLEVVEKVLSDASKKAQDLSQDMNRQHDLLQELLRNKASLTEVLGQGKPEDIAASVNAGKAETAGLAGAAPHMMHDPKVAYQLNILMSNLQTMVAREVENQLTRLRVQAEKMAQQTPQK